MPKQTINVTLSDIKNGTRDDEKNCAIAVSYKRITGRTCEVKYMGKSFQFALYDKDTGYCMILPKSVADFIYKYDLGDIVEPFQFDIITDEQDSVL